MHRTAFAGLTALDENDPITVDGSSFLHQNDVIDRFLEVGCVTHSHDAHPGLANPVAQLSAAVSPTNGQIEAGTTIYMGYTLSDSSGGETALSPVVSISTQGQIIPDLPPPTASASYAAGSLPVGGYSYAFVYRDEAGGQTELQPAVFATREAGHEHGEIILSGLAAGLSSGLVSWEAWRAEEGGAYDLLASGTTDTFTDSGFTCTDCSATPPTENTTNHTSELTIQLPSPEDDPAVGLATTISVYLSTNGSFTSPSLFAAYPAASGGATITLTALLLGIGAPPPVSRSTRGANRIDPDSEISGPWKKSVANFAALPMTGNENGDVRETRNDHIIYAWDAEGNAWILIGSGGGGGGGGSGHIIQNPAGADMPPEAKMQFTGAVEVSDDPEHTRTIVRVGSGVIIHHRGLWAASATYKPGDAVERTGGSYLALTINTGVDPSTDGGANWGILAVGGAEGSASGVAIRWRGPWSNSVTYSLDDAASYEGGSYVSLASGNLGSAPTASGDALWGVIALPGHGFTFRGPWSGATTYEAQDIVEREGKTFVSRINENTGVDPLLDGGHTHWYLFVDRGKEGAAGPKGEPGASGVPGLRYRGNWAAGSAYIKGDVVSRGGSSVVSTNASSNINHDPQTDGFINWGLLAGRGAAGLNGAPGTPGTPGTPGEPGAPGAKILITGLRFKGEWSSAITYAAYDVVLREGKYYISTSGSNLNHDPAIDEVHWVIFTGEGPLESHTWAIPNEVAPGNRPGFDVLIGTAEQSQRLVGISYNLESGTAIVEVLRNGVVIPGLEKLELSPAKGEKLAAKTKKEEEEGHFAPVTLATGDTISINVLSGSEPIGLTVTAFIEHVSWGDTGSKGVSLSAYSEKAEVALNKSRTLSENEAASVILTLSWETAGASWAAEIYVGGVHVGSFFNKDPAGGVESDPVSFILGAGEDYEVRATGSIGGLKLYESFATVAAGAQGSKGPEGKEGAKGKDGVGGGLALEDADVSIPNATSLDFVGSGGTNVDLDSLGGGSGRVTITTIPGIAVQSASGLELYDRVMLDFTSSGGVGVDVKDLGGGSARVMIGVTDTDTGGGGGGGAGSGITVGGSAGINPQLLERFTIGFAASGNASVAVQDMGGGSAQVLISATGGGGGEPEAWKTLEPIAPWTNFGAPFDNLEYRKNAGNIELRGVVHPAESTNIKAVHIATLPESHWPTKERIIFSGTHVLGASEAAGPMAIIAEPDGKIYLYKPNSDAEVKIPGDYVTLDGVIFSQ